MEKLSVILPKSKTFIGLGGLKKLQTWVKQAQAAGSALQALARSESRFGIWGLLDYYLQVCVRTGFSIRVLIIRTIPSLLSIERRFRDAKLGFTEFYHARSHPGSVYP